MAEGCHDVRHMATPPLGAVCIDGHIADPMRRRLHMPRPAPQRQQRSGGHPRRPQTGDPVDHFHPFLPRFLGDAVPSSRTDRGQTRPSAVASHGLTGRERALLAAPMATSHRAGGLWSGTRQRERTAHRQSAAELPLMLCDEPDVIAPAGPKGVGDLPWGQQGIQRDHPTRHDERAQHRLDLCARMGLVVHRLVGQGQAPGVGQGRQPVAPRRAVRARAPQRFPIQRHGRVASRLGWEGADDDPLRPGTPLRFHGVAVSGPTDRVQRCGTRRGVGKTQGLRDPRTVMAPPCGAGTRAARATHQRTTGQGEHGGPGLAVAPTTAQGSKRGEDLDEGLRLC